MYSAISPAHRVARELESDTALVESISYGPSSPRVGVPAEASVFLHDGTVVTLYDISCVEDLGFTCYAIHRGSVRHGTLDIDFRYPVLGDKFNDVVAEMKRTLESLTD